MTDSKRGSQVGISASKGAAILSKEFNPYQTEFSIWQGWIEKLHPGINERLGYTMPERPTGPQLAWGHAFEDSIARLAEEKQGEVIAARERFVSVNDPVPMLGYIDGMYRNEGGKIHEAKTTSYYYWRDNFGEPGTDRVPASYQIQCQHYMMLTGATETILSVLVFPKRVDDFEKEGTMVFEQVNGQWTIKTKNENRINPLVWANSLNEMGYFHQYHIHANQRLQSLMLDAYSEWWERYIIGQTPPEPQDYADITRMCAAPVGTIIMDDEDLVNRKRSIYPELNADIKKLNQQKEAIKCDVLNYARQNTHQVDQVCPIDRHWNLTTCDASCMLDRCVVGDKIQAIDSNSKDKWLILDQTGKKVASWSNKNGKFSFR